MSLILRPLSAILARDTDKVGEMVFIYLMLGPLH